MVNIKTSLSLLPFILLLTACETYPPRPYSYWAKEGVSRQAAQDQLGYCRHDTRATDLSPEHAKKLVGYCMKSKGYEIRTEYR